jgi:hypothetical protein
LGVGDVLILFGALTRGLVARMLIGVRIDSTGWALGCLSETKATTAIAPIDDTRTKANRVLGVIGGQRSLFLVF